MTSVSVSLPGTYRTYVTEESSTQFFLLISALGVKKLFHTKQNTPTLSRHVEISLAASTTVGSSISAARYQLITK
jgi:hypothetical protein